MEKDKKISIIIPAKNEEKRLLKTLEALKSQKGVKIETIVCISPDTKDKTKEIAKKHNCKIARGGFPATARNNGAKKASYEILFFLDADTCPENENFLSKAFQEFSERDLDLAGVLLEHNYPEKNFKSSLYDFIFYIEKKIFLNREKTQKPKMQSGMFFKKEIFFSLKGFREGIFGEDCEIAERAVNHNPKFKFGLLKSCGFLKNSVRRFENEGILRYLLKIVYLHGKARIIGYGSLKGSIKKYFNNNLK